MRTSPAPSWAHETPGFGAAFATEFAVADTEELALLDGLLPQVPADALILDLGAGSGRLVRAVGEVRPLGFPVGIEISAAALAAAPKPVRSRLIRGDFAALPFPDACCFAIVSGLLSLNYAGSAAAFRHALSEAARTCRAGAVLVAELALAHEPGRLAGLSERAGRFEFLYHDPIADSAGGCVLRAQIDIGPESSHFQLFVPALSSFRGLLADAGWKLDALFAPHDLASRTLQPPADCLRAVVLAHRM